MDSTMHYPISKAAELIGVSVSTLRKWDMDGILKPARMVGTHRRYSEEQIKNCNKNFDPDTSVTCLTKEDIERFWKNAGTVSKAKLRLVDSIKQRYEDLWSKLVALAGVIHVKNIEEQEYHRVNTLLVSDDVAEMIQLSTVICDKCNQIDDKPIARLGTICSVWKVYRCKFLEPGQILMGVTVDGTFDATRQKLASLSLEDVVLV